MNKDVHTEVGFNLRFNDIQAAIGRVLLRRLDAMNDRRRALAHDPPRLVMVVSSSRAGRCARHGREAP